MLADLMCRSQLNNQRFSQYLNVAWAPTTIVNVFLLLLWLESITCRWTCWTAQWQTAHCSLERVAYPSTVWTQTPSWIWQWMNWDSGSFTLTLNMVETWLLPNSIKVEPAYLHGEGAKQVWWWATGLGLTVSPLTSGSLAVEYTWDTQCKSRDAEGAFLICGTLYVVYNTRHGGRSTVQCLYDIHDTIHRCGSREPHSLPVPHLKILAAFPFPLILQLSQCHVLFLLQWRKPCDILPKALHQPQQHPLPPGRQEAVHLGRRLPDRVHGGDPEEWSGACG